ncbi:MAG: HEAT repeat domain-containing protein, partial [Adhaeribacter sp.]
LKLPQITDLDVDGSGRLYLSAWDGAGYSGNPGKGYVVRAVPANWTFKPFPDLKKASTSQLAAMLRSGSAVARQHAQQELLSRPAKKAAKAAWKIAADASLPLYARVAGIYTYAQAAGEQGHRSLVKLTAQPQVREFALRALADRGAQSGQVPLEPFLQALNDADARVRVAATIALGRLGRQEAAQALLQVPLPASFRAPAPGTEGPHATPNPGIVPAHVAVQALVRLNAVDACVQALSGPQAPLALWALRYMHDPKAVDGLIKAYGQAREEGRRKEILTTLSRLYHREAPYDGSWWWSTRPDTHGPYYKGIAWQASPAIESFLKQEWEKAGEKDKEFFAHLNGRHRMGITAFGGEEAVASKEETKIDLEKIRNQKGQIGKSSIEDVMLAMEKLKGDAKLGKSLFTRQGCIACHSLKKGEPMKGPFMGQVGSIMNREQIAESILKPNASISQGFASVQITARGDKNYLGFISEESADKLVLRTISGQVHTIKTADVLSRKELETSMMPAGLANALSYEEFASLITFLAQQKK